MNINLNHHNIAYKNALGNAIQIVGVFWGSYRKSINRLLAYAIA
jgi:hypothetical protein